jgi:predicted nucleotidyltransferase
LHDPFITMADQDPRTEVLPRVLSDLVDAARTALGDDLRSVVLFGSAAEDRLRATSDVNVIFVLRAFELARVDALRETLQTAQAAIDLRPMFLRSDEIPLATEAFAVKLADVARRHRVLYGDDPFVGIRPSRAAEVARLQQVLLNLELRLRQRYALESLREEQAAIAVADATGPLRASAAALLELRGQAFDSPREALVRFAAQAGDAALAELVARLSQVRETRALPAGTAAKTLGDLLGLTHALREAAQALAP